MQRSIAAAEDSQPDARSQLTAMARTTTTKPGSLVVLAVLLGVASALPRHAPVQSSSPAAAPAPTPPNFVGEATNEIATLMLQGFADKDRNVAFSPLGYSALLAQLAEGARGRTREQLAMVLRLPDDTGVVRAAYKEVLLRLREKNVVNKPELRTWFYVYKNHSVEPAYKEILKEYYLTEVKSVTRPTEALGFSPLGEEKLKATEAPPKQSGSISNLTPQQQQQQQSDEGGPGAELEDAMALGAMKEGVLIETALQEEAKRLIEEKKKAQELKMKEEQAAIEHIRDGQEQMQDQMKDQAQMQEQMQGQTQMQEQMQGQTQMQEQTQMNEQMQQSQGMVEKEQMKDEQMPQQSQIMLNEQKEKPVGNEQMKEEMQGQIEQSSQTDEMMMVTSKRRKVRTEQREAEAEVGAALGIAAAASPSLSDGVSQDFVKVNNGSSARMLLFNGMYFRGSWASPFKPLSQPQPFYLSPERKAALPAMTARGDFRMGRVPELDADAIELPYEGGRYALLVLVPRSAGGLRGLVADLAGFSLSSLTGSLQRQAADVTLPCFAVETITRPIPTFTKAGVRDVFTAGEADLSGVCADGALYVQDLVQLVTLRVDDASSAANHLTSAALESRTEPQDKLTVDKPFVYFVRDVVDNIVMVAGKVVNPEEKPTPYA